MKQHITVDQLNELSPKAKEKLRKWWKPELGDQCFNEKFNEKTIISDEDEYYPIKTLNGYVQGIFTPLLSIGQMIEFLDENNYPITLMKVFTEEFTLDIDIVGSKQWIDKEPINILWEAVKEILESK